MVKFSPNLQNIGGVNSSDCWLCPYFNGEVLDPLKHEGFYAICREKTNNNCPLAWVLMRCLPFEPTAVSDHCWKRNAPSITSQPGAGNAMTVITGWALIVSCSPSPNAQKQGCAHLCYKPDMACCTLARSEQPVSLRTEGAICISEGRPAFAFPGRPSLFLS